MDGAGALAFLRAHQPMPPDDALEDSLIEQFDTVRKYLIAHPDPACIPLLLGAFGDGMGFGVYQVCDDVLRHFSTAQLAPHLALALASDRSSTRWWAAHWAMEFPHPSLFPELRRLLLMRAPEDEDARGFLIDAVESLANEYQLGEARQLLEELEHSAE